MFDEKPPPQSESEPVPSKLVERLTAFGDVLRGQTLPSHLAGESGDLGEELAVLADTVRRLEQRWPQDRPDAESRFSASVLIGDGTDVAGTPVGRFVLHHEIGRGGFGVVYKAHDPALGRLVALKLPRSDALASDHARARMNREAKIAATLDHPGIVPVYEAETSGPVSYIASMYCDGPDLGQWLRDAPHLPSPEQSAGIVAQLAEAVHYAHQNGVIHRDIKPSNVLLVPLDLVEGAASERLAFRPRLTDFGLAQMASDEWSKTRTSVIIGTPLYMAPECFDRGSDQWGAAGDTYSLGALLYELLTGKPPIEGETLGQLLHRIKHQVPAPPHLIVCQVPTDLSIICCKCLAKEAEDRYVLAGELADDLRRFLRGDQILAKETSWRDRLGRWRRQPERVEYAGKFTCRLNIVFVGWLLAVFSIGVISPSVPNEQAFRSLIDIILVSVTLHLPLAWLGHRLASGARWAFWPSGTGCLILTGALFHSAFASNGIFEYNYPTPISKISVHVGLISASMAALSTYILALPAYWRRK